MSKLKLSVLTTPQKALFQKKAMENMANGTGKSMREILVEVFTELAEKKTEKPLEFKKAPKGGLAVYGIQRFPITYYGDQWIKIVASVKDGSLEKALAELGIVVRQNDPESLADAAIED